MQKDVAFRCSYMTLQLLKLISEKYLTSFTDLRVVLPLKISTGEAVINQKLGFLFCKRHTDVENQ